MTGERSGITFGRAEDNACLDLTPGRGHGSRRQLNHSASFVYVNALPPHHFAQTPNESCRMHGRAVFCVGRAVVLGNADAGLRFLRGQPPVLFLGEAQRMFRGNPLLQLACMKR